MAEKYSGQIAEKKRLLSEDQMKSLAKNYEVENKLEADRKVKQAQELGFQPRQVTVWFQGGKPSNWRETMGVSRSTMNLSSTIMTPSNVTMKLSSRWYNLAAIC